MRLGIQKLTVICAAFLLVPSFIYADKFTFKADKMTGGKATGKEVTVLQGNAEVQSDSLVLKAERIELYGKNNNLVRCIGSVTGQQNDKGIYFKTDTMTYDRELKLARLEGNSTMEDKKNEIVARGRFIEYDEKKDITIFQIAVRLFKNNMVCRSEYAVYRREDKLLELSGFPVVYKKNDEFRADNIRVDLDTDDVFMEGDVTGSIKE
ncbi:MAG: LptA/OstA family protein [Spirochaetaceae bacterium]|jgi:lipopolysaccharide export system protein LptA|nr:LptA/OstA family protein [Spirochaetaceae bacterium]